MFDERRIEGTLKGVRDVIVYYGSQLDYSQYIKQVNLIIKQLQLLKTRSRDYAELARLENLECKALMYLNTMNKLQANFENQR